MIRELEALRQISECKGSGSNKIKQELLNNSATDIMKFLLEIAYYPTKSTKVNKLDNSHSSEYDDGDYHFEEFKKLINILFDSKAATNDLRSNLSSLVYGLNTTIENKEILKKIVTKSLNIGIGIKTINKAFGYDFLPDLSVMLATDKVSELFKWDEIHAEIKYDGVRCLAIYDKNKNYFKFITRNFNELNNMCLQNISKVLLEIAETNDIPHNYFFDGELTDKDRKSVSGKINKILSDTAEQDIDKDFVFNIFDFEDFSIIENSSTGNIPYLQRREYLIKYLSNIDSIFLKLSESWQLKTIEEVNSLFKDVVINGGEGLICKNPHQVYISGRDLGWIKMKEVNDCDLRIVGFYDGNGIREGLIGGVSCESEDKLLKVNVGSGFSNELLKEISNDKITYLNKIVSITYNVKIQDKDNNWSLFLPRLKEIRVDKNTANTLKEIK